MPEVGVVVIGFVGPRRGKCKEKARDLWLTGRHEDDIFAGVERLAAGGRQQIES